MEKPSNDEFYKIATYVQYGGTLPPGYTVIRTSDAGQVALGLEAQAIRTPTGQVIVAFRGPVPMPGTPTYTNDEALAQGREPPSFGAAREFIAQLRDANQLPAGGTFVTGYSQGATIAQKMGLENTYGGVTWGGTGVPDYNPATSNLPVPDIKNYLRYGDPVANACSESPTGTALGLTKQYHAGTVEWFGNQSDQAALAQAVLDAQLPGTNGSAVAIYLAGAITFISGVVKDHNWLRYGVASGVGQGTIDQAAQVLGLPKPIYGSIGGPEDLFPGLENPPDIKIIQNGNTSSLIYQPADSAEKYLISLDAQGRLISREVDVVPSGVSGMSEIRPKDGSGGILANNGVQVATIAYGQVTADGSIGTVYIHVNPTTGAPTGATTTTYSDGARQEMRADGTGVIYGVSGGIASEVEVRNDREMRFLVGVDGQRTGSVVTFWDGGLITGEKSAAEGGYQFTRIDGVELRSYPDGQMVLVGKQGQETVITPDTNWGTVPGNEGIFGGGAHEPGSGADHPPAIEIILGSDRLSFIVGPGDGSGTLYSDGDKDGQVTVHEGYKAIDDGTGSAPTLVFDDGHILNEGDGNSLTITDVNGAQVMVGSGNDAVETIAWANGNNATLDGDAGTVTITDHVGATLDTITAESFDANDSPFAGGSWSAPAVDNPAVSSAVASVAQEAVDTGNGGISTNSDPWSDLGSYSALTDSQVSASSSSTSGNAGASVSSSGTSTSDSSPLTSSTSYVSNYSSSSSTSRHSGCFTADTPILLADGTERAIAAILVGDSVLAFDGTGHLEPARVARIFVHENQEVMEVAGVKATPVHRFLTDDGEWTAAMRLKAGQAIVAADGGVVPYLGPKPVTGSHTVHNIEVEGLHTYVAGGLRVHNMKVGPVALDLNGDNVVDLVGLDESKVFFDADGDGFKENIGWVGASDGILAIDLVGDGKIDNADSIVFTRHAPNAQSDLEALSQLYDSNHDGKLDANDSAWAKFRVWQDANQNGVADSGEVRTLGQIGLKSINLTSNGIHAEDGGNIVKGVGRTVLNDGSTGTLADVALGYDPVGFQINEVRGNLVIGTAEDGRRRAVVRDGTRGSIDLGAEGVTDAIGSEGADLFYTSSGKAVYEDGAGGNDILVGGLKGDVLLGGGGDDRLMGLAGNDTLDGGSGEDSLDGGSGGDTLYGDGRTIRDTYAGSDTLKGGSGEDFLYGDARVFSGVGGNDVLQGGDDDDALFGDAEQLTGMGGNDTLVGGGGNDWLIGDGWSVDRTLPAGMTPGDAAGADVLEGDAGDDTIIGGMGNDVAIYRGNRADYEVTIKNGLTTVRDLRSAATANHDGTDQVTGVETLRFADQDVVLDGNSMAAAQNDLGVAVIRGAGSIDKAKLLANDVDADGDTLTITGVSSVSHGWVSMDATGNITFQAEADYLGTASFSYTVTDGKGSTSTAYAFVDVKAPLPTDPEVQYQWYLDKIGVLAAWDDYSGKGIRIGNFDGAVDYTLADIGPNYDSANDYDFVHGDSDAMVTGAAQRHATVTSSIMVGAKNGIGVVGIAYDAKLRVYQDYNDGDNADFTAMQNAFSRLPDVDVANIIGFYNAPLSVNPQAFPWIEGKFAAAAANGRQGLGTVMAVTGGNAYDGGNATTTNELTNSRFVIAVGGLEPDGSHGFSTPGASLLLSTYGVSIRADDRTGSAGFDPGDYVSIGGTCTAAPIISAVSALILEANARLGWRDVQEILAYSTTRNDAGNLSWEFNAAANWNGGGLHVSNLYGFGIVDARAAVRLAETWTSSHTSANEQMVSASSSRTLSIIDQGTIHDSVTVTSNLLIDHVEIDLDIDHANLGDLLVTLTSPDGTTSVLVDRPGVHRDGTGGSGEGGGTLHLTTSSVHDWGEVGNGTWTLNVTDAAGGAVGTLKPWTIRLYGDAKTADDTYIFTDEFGSFTSAQDADRRILSDGAGTDTINASAVSTAAYIDLRDGQSSYIASNQLTIESGTVIENVFTGDGLDTVAGNDAANLISGGRGDDTLSGGAGNDTLQGDQGNDLLVGDSGGDTLDGGAGVDTASYLASLSGVTVNLATGLADGGDATGDRLISIENVWGSNFADQIVGDDGANILIGFDGDDTLLGGVGADTLMGGAGADVIDGGYGIDAASYYSSSAGVSVNLASGLMQGGDAQDDILTGIEQVIGSRWGDTITGDVGDNVLSGEDGNDVVNGGDGNDTLFGGEGSDTLLGGEGGDLLYGGAGADVIDGGNGLNTVVYLDSTQGVTVNLALGQGHGGDAEGDILSNIAGVNGSMFADTLTGSSGSDWLWGLDGNDTLTGGSGNDSLVGGNGNDVAVFSGSATVATITKAGDDWIVNAGADGIDAVSSIEELRFSDRSVWLDGRNNSVVATNDRVTTTKGESITLALSTLLANDRDFDGDIMHVTAVQATQGGSVVLDGLGNVIFTPTVGFSGMAGFSYTVDDGRGGVATASVDVVVQGGTNVAPVATNSMAFVQTPGIISGKLTAQDADNARSELSFSMATGAAHGTVVVNPNGTFTYTANTGYSGEDSFTYRVADPSGLDSTARIDVRVSAPARYNQIFQVNQYSSDQQQLPSISAFPNGDYVVSWSSLYQDGSAYGVYARRFDAGGNPLGNEFLVNQTTNLNQATSSVTVLADGSFVVAWSSDQTAVNGWDIYARHFNRDGSPQSGEFRANTYVANEQSAPAVCATADGGFVVTWDSDGQDGSSFGVYGQRYNAIGASQGGEFRLNQYTTSYQFDRQVVGLKGGGFVAIWTSDGQDGSGFGVYGRVYGANGAPLGNEFAVNESPQYGQWQPAVAATDDGGFTVAWQDGGAMYGLGWDISARHFSANGTTTGVTRYPNLTGGNYSGSQTSPAISVLSSGGIVVVWSSVNIYSDPQYNLIDIGNWGSGTSQIYSGGANVTPVLGNAIYSAVYDKDGNGPLSVSQLASFSADESTLWNPQVVGLPDGGYAVTWASTQGTTGSAEIFGKVISSPFRVPTTNEPFAVTGTVGNDVLTGGDNDDTLIGGSGDDTLDAGGDAYTCDTLIGGDGNDILRAALGYATLDGGAGDDVLIASSYMTTLNGGIGNDTLVITGVPGAVDLQAGTYSSNGSITGIENVVADDNQAYLRGDGGINTLIGGAGDDALEGRGGADYLDGGNGVDVAVYTNSSAGISIGLDGRVGHGGEAEGDRLVNIETVYGTAYDDSLIGNTGNETLYGGSGNDFLAGGGGADKLDGGGGVNTVSYGTSNAGVSVNLATGLGAGGDAQGDQLTYINNLIGSSFGDTLIGDGQDNTLTGGAGADSLNGGAGIDMASYADSTSGVSVNLATGIGTGGDAEGDRLSNIEIIEGSAFSDTLTGSVGISTLKGGTGIDTAVFACNWRDASIVRNSNTIVVTVGSATTTLIGMEEARFADRTIYLDGRNNVPDARSDSLSTGENTPLVISPSALLSNDRDPDADVLSIAAVSSSTHGRALIQDDGTIRFVPDTNYSGPASFSYTVSDGRGGDVSSTVDITVIEADDFFTAIAAAEPFNGGTGNDTVSYVNSATAVTVDLATGSGSGGFAQGDSFISIENVTGSGLADTLKGTNGANTLSGGAGDDLLEGGAGADRLDGGAGTDTASYAGASAGVVVSLATGSGSQGDAFGDVLTGIENLTGSGTDDVLTGDSGGNVLMGSGGNDTLIGGGGADTLDGGAGSDTVSYSDSAAGVRIDLGGHTAIGGSADGDVLTGIENLEGSSQADILIGDGGSNILSGGAGNDTLRGGTGDDTLIGGAGLDSAEFSGSRFDYQIARDASGTVTVTGADGRDILSGIETLSFTDGSVYLDRNNAPATRTKTLSGTEDSFLSISAASLLGNDRDFDGDALTLFSVSNAVGGLVVLNGDGSVTFTPSANFNGTATFDYTISDGHGGFATQTVMVNVAAANDAPAALAQSLLAQEDTARVITVAELASDVDGDPLTLSGVGNAVGGSVVLNGDGSVTFTPSANFNGNATFDYTVSDGHGGSTTQTATVVVAAVNDAPVAVAQNLSAVEDTAKTFAAAELLAGASDVDGDAPTLSGVDNAVGACATLNADGTVTFTPDADFNGRASFDYTVSDGNGGFATQTATVNVSAVNDAPMAVSRSLSAAEDTAKTFVAVELLAGASDVDGDVPTLSGVGNAVGGSATLNGDGTVTFTPDMNFSGTASFDYTISDGHGGFDTQTVAVNVAAVNDAPVAVAKSVTINEDVALIITATGLLAGASDVDGDGLTLSSVGNAVNGSVSLDASGNVMFTPTANFFGQASFDYTIADGNGGFDTKTVMVTINAPPIALPKSVATDEGTALTISASDLLAGATDADGDSLTVPGVGNAVGGSVVLDASGNAVFTPTAHFAGMAGFDYTISDGHGGFNTKTVSVAVGGIPADTGEFRVNSYVAGDLGLLRLSTLADGGFVATWLSYLQDGSGYGVYGQRYSAGGRPIGGEFQVNTFTANNQEAQQVIALADGGFLVAWTSYGENEDVGSSNILAQRYGADGQRVGGEFQVNTYTNSNQFFLQSAALAGGGFIVTWASNLQDGSGYGVYGQHYGADGNPLAGEFQINTYTVGNQTGPVVTALADGGFVVTWTSAGQDGNGNGVYGQRYGGDGRLINSEFRVNTYTAGNQAKQQVTALSDGGFVVTWQSNGQDGNGTGVYAQRFDVNSQPAGTEFRVNTSTIGNQYASQITALAGGGFVVVWQSIALDGTAYGVFGQRYGADGRVLGGEFRADTATFGSMLLPQVAALADGGFMVTWQSDQRDGSSYGVYAQRYDADGLAVGDETQINAFTPGFQCSPQIIALADGAVVITWVSANQDAAGGFGVCARALGQAGFVGGTGDDVITGTSVDEVLVGLGGNDTLTGGGGSDTYVFALGGESDIIVNAGHAADGDKVLFGANIAIDQLWFQQAANDLKVSIIGTDDNVTVSGWFGGSSNHVSTLQTADGHTLADTAVQNLVAAMASMTPPPIGQTTLTTQQHQQLDTVIAANWH